MAHVIEPLRPSVTPSPRKKSVPYNNPSKARKPAKGKSKGAPSRPASKRNKPGKAR